METTGKAPEPMTASERDWLKETRFAIRCAALASGAGYWETAVGWVKAAVSNPPDTESASEVVDLLMSSSLVEPATLARNVAVRAAFMRRLDETKSLIGEILVGERAPNQPNQPNQH